MDSLKINSMYLKRTAAVFTITLLTQILLFYNHIIFPRSHSANF